MQVKCDGGQIVRERAAEIFEGNFEAGDKLLRARRIFQNGLRAFEGKLLAAGEGYSMATDVADYLAKKGVPFRDAHAITGKLVRDCIAENRKLTDLTLEEFRAASDKFGEDILAAVTVRASAEGRNSVGGSSVSAARAGISSIRRLKKY